MWADEGDDSRDEEKEKQITDAAAAATEVEMTPSRDIGV